MPIAPDKDGRKDPKEKPMIGLLKGQARGYSAAMQLPMKKKIDSVPGKEQKINMAKAAAARLREKRR